ncbi:hypothetical protein J2T02_002630 [Chitinophaga terrae (ex Kim and Jung 2007)]|nr:hypothetical protein [Chitinophaga terrae (ex Kim and Jung 2007)]
MKRVLPLSFVIILSVSSAIYSSEHNYYQDVRYKITDNPSLCRYPASLPGNCVTIPLVAICTFPEGSYQKTYYQDINCVNPYFKNQ